MNASRGLLMAFESLHIREYLLALSTYEGSLLLIFRPISCHPLSNQVQTHSAAKRPDYCLCSGFWAHQGVPEAGEARPDAA